MKENDKKLKTEIYEDLGKPSTKAIGKTMALIPRALNAFLSPIEKWIMRKEYALEKTKKLLEEKLKNIDPSKLDAPETYVAVPAIDALSYTFSSNDLVDLYTNLLASSMIKDKKWKVHPSFVEIIKQLSPDEAKLLKYISTIGNVFPLINIKLRFGGNKGFIIVLNHFTDIANGVCDYPDAIVSYLDNLERLKIINIDERTYFKDDTIYNGLRENPKVKRILETPTSNGDKYEIVKGKFEITNFGKLFVDLCVKDAVNHN